MQAFVVAPQPIAVKAGQDMYEVGGNAFDAAVATAFVQGIVDPQMNGIGGWGTLTCIPGNGAEPLQLDFYGRVPKKFPIDLWRDRVTSVNRAGGGYVVDGYENQLGHRSVTTPGTVKGLWEMHSRFGRLPWVDVLAPAIRLGHEGVPVSQELYDLWVAPAMPGYVPFTTKLSHTPANHAIFHHANGSLYQPDEIIRHEDYAATLTRLAEGGADEFYKGGIAREIVADFTANEGFLGFDDLADYEVDERMPLLGEYRGYSIHTNPPPGSGLQVIELLNVLEGFDLGRMDPESPEYVDLTGRALQATFADRARYLGDPEFVDVPVDRLLSKSYAAEVRDRITSGAFTDVPVPGGIQRLEEGPDTTHVCTFDPEGNAVSLTHTLASASGVVTPGLGFTYNNAMHLFNPMPGYANSLAPSKRRITGMAPVIVARDGRPVLVVGAPGGTRIVSAVLHTILNVIDHGMSAIEAVSAPRWHCEGNILELEARLYWACSEPLRRMGWEKIFRSSASYDRFFALAHAIQFREDGRIVGGADPRGGGGVAKWPVT